MCASSLKKFTRLCEGRMIVLLKILTESFSLFLQKTLLDCPRRYERKLFDFRWMQHDFGGQVNRTEINGLILELKGKYRWFIYNLRYFSVYLVGDECELKGFRGKTIHSTACLTDLQHEGCFDLQVNRPLHGFFHTENLYYEEWFRFIGIEYREGELWRRLRFFIFQQWTVSQYGLHSTPSGE